MVLGIATLFWLPVEDLNERRVLFFAATICALVAARYLIVAPLTTRLVLWYYIFVGTLAGLVVSPVAVLLMAFKSGLHGHATPDFTPAQVVAVLWRAPVWGGSGFLLGLSAGLWRKFR